MWESIAAGTISGVIAGLIVAAALGVLNQWNRPRFQLRQVAPNTAVLTYSRWPPVVIGGSYALERGSVLSTAEGFRAGTGGIYLVGPSETVLRTDAGLGELNVGEVVDISYRFAPWFPLDRSKRMMRAVSWEVDPFDTQPRWWRWWGWKRYTLVLHPS
ncbi:hypothetical protein [Corynebacterium pilosum]|uniref:Uncharacterized protein n=1 Tax=Corynebacterium pilosum TaxID=35756 RepID=A0A376CLX9_9CORY|nr:hypothetical protein [Corynebacterium pilosum]STC69272.1 Uncharacterised protein [Corynebacterium pilosum]